MARLPIFHFTRALLIGSVLLWKTQAFISTPSLSYRRTFHPSIHSFSISESGSIRNLVHSPRRHCLSFTRTRMASTNSDDKNNQADGLGQSITDDDDIKSQDVSMVESIVTRVGSSTSKVVAGTFFVTLAYRRDALMVSFFVGAISNGILSKILKKMLNQERPDGYLTNENIKSKPGDKGMPSSHAMSLGFIGTFTYLLLSTNFSPFLVASILIPYIYCSLSYRVKGGLHTLDQIIVGITVGSSNGWFWHSLVMGNNIIFPNVNIVDMVRTHLLPESGIFPIPYLIIPALVGLAVVGSFERRISKFLKNRNEKANAE